MKEPMSMMEAASLLSKMSSLRLATKALTDYECRGIRRALRAYIDEQLGKAKQIIHPLICSECGYLHVSELCKCKDDVDLSDHPLIR